MMILWLSGKEKGKRRAKMRYRSVNAECSFLAEEQPEMVAFRDVHRMRNGYGLLNDTTIVPKLAVAMLG